MRRLAALLTAVTLSACAAGPDGTDGSQEPLGDFRLGYSEVVAPNIQKLFVSEQASAEEWTEAVDRAIETRLGRFDGPRFYHLGISVEGYSLPPPIVPGESYLAMRVTVWDDAEQAKLKQDAELVLSVIVFENRLGMTREQRIDSLARTAARDVESWLRKQQREAGWFGGPDAARPAPRSVAPAPTAASAAGQATDQGEAPGATALDSSIVEAVAGAGPGDEPEAPPSEVDADSVSAPADVAPLSAPDASRNAPTPGAASAPAASEDAPETGPATVPQVESAPLS